tara:strand:- start:61 stop:168 length:108 start_codon:yes stop_codon:yes gene_type:complete
MLMVLSIIDEWLKEKYEEKQKEEFLKKEFHKKPKN